MKLWPFGPARPRYLACCEYWLYLPKSKLPPQTAYMARMLKVNPFRPDLPPGVQAPEALLFSDIRLHIALVLREKNSHVFRPDLFEPHVVPTAEHLEHLSSAAALAKLQYLSFDRLPDDRHLQFMPYLAGTVAALTNGRVLFDAVAEELASVEDLGRRLGEDGDARTPGFHVRCLWIPTEHGGRGVTRGLIKIGLPELETPESASDHQVLIHEVLEGAVEKLWLQRDYPERVTVRCFEDEFEVLLSYRRKGPAIARILRIHA